MCGTVERADYYLPSSLWCLVDQRLDARRSNKERGHGSAAGQLTHQTAARSHKRERVLKR